MKEERKEKEKHKRKKKKNKCEGKSRDMDSYLVSKLRDFDNSNKLKIIIQTNPNLSVFLRIPI